MKKVSKKWQPEKDLNLIVDSELQVLCQRNAETFAENKGSLQLTARKETGILSHKHIKLD